MADDVPRAACHSTARHGVDGPKMVDDVDGGFDPKLAVFCLVLFGDEKRLIHGELDSKI